MPQGLDCTWPRLGSASQVCFENNPALRTLTTSTFKSEEEEEKGSLPACPSWVVSACLATYVPCVSIRPCQRWYSHHHNTFLTSFKYSESCVQNSKKICCKLCDKYAANLLPYRRWRVASNLAQGQGTLAKPRQALMYLANRGRRGAFSSPERSPTGRPVA